MKKIILIGIIILIQPFTLANSFPLFPMTIYGNIQIGDSPLDGGTIKVYNSSNEKLITYDITEIGKYGSDNVSKLPLLLNEFEGNLIFKVLYEGKTYIVDKIDDSHKKNICPDKSSITFVSDNCRYDITLKEEIKDNGTGNNSTGNSSTEKEEIKSQGYSGGGGRSSTKVSTTKTSNITKDTQTNRKGSHSSPENSNTNAKKMPIDYMIPTINNIEYNGGNSSGGQENGFTRERNNAYGFAYANGITTIKNIEKANLSGSITRAAMAKMLSNYAINVLGKEPDKSKTPHFGDISKETDKQYDNGITLAYQLGIMGVGTKNFRPYDPVTRKEFATILSRMLYNTEDGTGKTKYYEPHIAKLYDKGIISKTNPEIVEKRGNVMTMLMRSAK